MTEIEERRRRQALRTLITEIFMFVVIIALVIILALVAMGYRINFETGFEHSGLVQINSIPTGAAIIVDGEGVFLPTNQSRTMLSGSHEITLTKEGYTSWSKSINVTEGMMYRLGYPRLYKEDRESSEISLALEGESSAPLPTQAFVSPDRKLLLLNFADDEWRYIRLNDDQIRAQAIPTNNILSGEIEIIAWFDNNSRLLLKKTTDSHPQWCIFNLNNPAESINLSQEFGLDFSELRIENGDKLLALNAGNLHEISISTKEISKVLLSDVESFVNLNSSILYLSAIPAEAKSSTDLTVEDTPTRGIFSITIGDDDPVFVAPVEENSKVLLCLSEYYGDFYFAYSNSQQFYIYSGKFPSSGDSFASQMKPVASALLDFTPLTLTRRGDSELIVAENGQQLAVFDAESYSISSFSTESNPTWLTDFDFYSVKDAWLTVHDFDNSNPHALVNDVSATLPATISENNRYLYYFDSALTLKRESIR